MSFCFVLLHQFNKLLNCCLEQSGLCSCLEARQHCHQLPSKQFAEASRHLVYHASLEVCPEACLGRTVTCRWGISGRKLWERPI